MTPERRRKLVRRLRQGLLWGSAAIVLLLIGTELVARFAFGLCDPPLLLADADMEYLFAPSQHCRMFGNEIAFNRYSMRSPEFAARKAKPDEFRVMVFGDSVVYGGTKVNQRELATSRLRDSLESRLHRPVIVGNIAAGSWGPPNMAAYARRYGFFDADVVVVIVSSHDVSDAMTFEPVVGLDPDHPSHKPRLALWEIATRYLPRFLAIRHQANSAPEPAPTTEPAADVAASMAGLRDIIERARQTGARVLVAQHLERTELDGHFMIGHDMIKQVVESEGIEPLQFGPSFKSLVDRGVSPYRDFIHPSAAGHEAIAKVLEDAIVEQAKTN